ncbi:hypothetical protein PAPHI01_2795, partial [Pancytospora philotis]
HPITFYERPAGESKISPREIVYYLMAVANLYLTI